MCIWSCLTTATSLPRIVGMICLMYLQKCHSWRCLVSKKDRICCCLSCKHYFATITKWQLHWHISKANNGQSNQTMSMSVRQHMVQGWQARFDDNYAQLDTFQAHKKSKGLYLLVATLLLSISEATLPSRTDGAAPFSALHSYAEFWHQSKAAHFRIEHLLSIARSQQSRISCTTTSHLQGDAKGFWQCGMTWEIEQTQKSACGMARMWELTIRLLTLHHPWSSRKHALHLVLYSLISRHSRPVTHARQLEHMRSYLRMILHLSKHACIFIFIHVAHALYSHMVSGGVQYPIFTIFRSKNERAAWRIPSLIHETEHVLSSMFIFWSFWIRSYIWKQRGSEMAGVQWKLTRIFRKN